MRARAVNTDSFLHQLRLAGMCFCAFIEYAMQQVRPHAHANALNDYKTWSALSSAINNKNTFFALSLLLLLRHFIHFFMNGTRRERDTYGRNCGDCRHGGTYQWCMLKKKWCLMARCELTIWFTAHRMTWFQKMRDVRLMEDTNRVAYDLRMNDGSLDPFRLLFFVV